MLASPTLAKDWLREYAAAFYRASRAAGSDIAEEWDEAEVRGRYRDTAATIERVAHDGDLQAASRLASPLRLLADDSAGRGLIALTHAVPWDSTTGRRFQPERRRAVTTSVCAWSSDRAWRRGRRRLPGPGRALAGAGRADESGGRARGFPAAPDVVQASDPAAEPERRRSGRDDRGRQPLSVPGPATDQDRHRIVEAMQRVARVSPESSCRPRPRVVAEETS